MAEEKRAPIQTVLMTVLIDPATFIPESITAERMTPEYSRQLGVARQCQHKATLCSMT